MNIYAGKSSGDPFLMGSAAQVRAGLIQHNGQLQIGLSQSFTMNITLQSETKISGTLAGYPDSKFFIHTTDQFTEGYVIVSKENDIAYKYITNENNEVYLQPTSINDIICVDYRKVNNTSIVEKQVNSQKEIPKIANGPVPVLNSDVNATNVLYLDFDGYSLPAGTVWSDVAVDAKPAGYSNAQIFMAWSIIAEDYSPFNVNVTTSETVFNNTPTNKKMRLVYTPTDWYPNAGGVCYVGVFDNGDNSDPGYKVAWTFVFGTSNADVDDATESGTHELGHSLGLDHDGRASAGEEYYGGHSAWAPIMGVAYGQAISQFSKGEYADANNTQDDLSIIAGYLSWRNDDHGNTQLTASNIPFTMQNTVGVVDSVFGTIHNSADIDVFQFYTGGGLVDLTFKPSYSVKNDLDMQVTLYNEQWQSQTVLTTPHNANIVKGVALKQTLPAGNYYVAIDGIGTGTPTNGYSDYASIGTYYIKGTIPDPQQTTGLYDLEKQNFISIYPNPIGENNQLNFSSSVEQVKVYDVTRKFLFSARNVNQISIEDQGVFFVEITKNEKVIVAKIIR